MKWEHLTVIIRFNYDNGKIRETTISGQTKVYPPQEQLTIQEYLKALGQEGWDLVGIVGVDTYLFSRLAREE